MAGSQDFFSEIKSEVKDLGSKMNKLFDEVVRGNKASAGSLEIPTDITETPAAYIYEIDLPGMTKKDVVIEIRDNQLLIKGERVRNADENVIQHLKERAFGDFERFFSLPAGIEVERIKAKFELGILTITLPKEQEEEPAYDAKTINID